MPEISAAAAASSSNRRALEEEEEVTGLGVSSVRRPGAAAAAVAAAPLIPSIGRDDLDPFSNIAGRPLVPSAYQPAFGGPEGGSLIGPDHPIFADRQPLGSEGPPLPGFPLPGVALPQPRFDPYGPIGGPNTDFGFDDDPFGFDPHHPGAGRGGRRAPGRLGGRLGGRGAPRGPFPGEPNPDHFKPPGF